MAKTQSKSIASANVYDKYVPPVRDGRVSVSVDPALIEFVDEYARAQKTTRSAIFEQALEMWVRWQQEQMDAAYYSNMNEAEKSASESWNAITMEAAKHTFK